MGITVDEPLRRFLESAYGFKLLEMARINGKSDFKFGGKKYKLQDLLDKAYTFRYSKTN